MVRGMWAFSVALLLADLENAMAAKRGDPNPNPGWEKYYGGKCDEFMRCAGEGDNVCLEKTAIPLCNLEVQQTGIPIPWQRGLAAAVEHGRLSTVILFITSPLQWWDKDDLVNEAEETVLIHAAAHGEPEILQWLLKQGADIRKTTKDGEAAMDLARTSDNSEKTVAAIRDFATMATARLMTMLRTNSVGSAQDIERCLRGGALLTEIDLETQLPPLGLAVKNGMVEAVKKLLGSGAPSSYHHPRTGLNILHMACDRGHYQITEALLAAGADVNSLTTQFDMNCLHLAAMNGRNGIALQMVQAGVDVNAKDWEGETALLKYARQIYGAGGSQETVLQRILDAGADTETRDSDGRTALYYAVDHNQVGGVRALVGAGAHINEVVIRNSPPVTSEEKQTSGAASSALGAFQQAVYSGSREVAEWLVKSGHREAFTFTSLKGTAEGRGETLSGLYAVVAQGWSEVATDMLRQSQQASEEVNQANLDGSTPLFAAASKGMAELASTMLSHGARVNHLNRKGESPLHFAASAGQDKVLAVLVAAGADVNKKDKHLQTPLYRAAARGFFSVAMALLRAGGSPELKGYAGGGGGGQKASMAQLETPAQCARRNGHSQVADMIQNYSRRQTDL